VFEKYGLKLISAFELDENVWWNDYYRWLNDSVAGKGDRFGRELEEIEEYKKDPHKFRSIYYVIEK
jgi:hypothetical protein